MRICLHLPFGVPLPRVTCTIASRAGYLIFAKSPVPLMRSHVPVGLGTLFFAKSPVPLMRSGVPFGLYFTAAAGHLIFAKNTVPLMRSHVPVGLFSLLAWAPYFCQNWWQRLSATAASSRSRSRHTHTHSSRQSLLSSSRPACRKCSRPFNAQICRA